MFFFFFQAEDGIRDVAVTGVQTCALPISRRAHDAGRPRSGREGGAKGMDECSPVHAPSCREIGSVARLAGIAQSLSNAVEGGREPGADRPWRGVAVTLALQQRDRKSVV